MKTQKGFIVPLLIAIIVVLVVGGGYYIYSSKKVSVQEFPTQKLTFSSPDSWKITYPKQSDADMLYYKKQFPQYEFPQHVLLISPDEKSSGPSCSMCNSGPGAAIAIFAYEVEKFSSAKEWYQSRDRSTPPIFGSPLGRPTIDPNNISERKFAGQHAYCLGYSNDKYYSDNLPSNLPLELFSGCFILWKNEIYGIKIMINKDMPNYSDDLLKAIAILESIKFIN